MEVSENQTESRRDHPLFTVFTATYNRAHTLHRVYESLKNQTFRDFEWIVGDDGSTDDTKDLIEKWKQESPFPLRYFIQEHFGKQFVFNRGVQEAKGEYFVSLDSDNALLPEALGKFRLYWNEIPPAKRNEYYAIFTFCKDVNGNLIGKFHKQSPLDISLRRWWYTIASNEMYPVFKAEVLRQFPFPDLKGYHLHESNMIFEMDKRYRSRFVNDVLHIYYQDGPSVTRQPRHPLQNIEGDRRTMLYLLNNDLEFFLRRPLRFLRCAWNFSRFSFHYGIGLSGQWLSLTNFQARFLWLLTLPVAFLKYGLDHLKGLTPPENPYHTSYHSCL